MLNALNEKDPEIAGLLNEEYKRQQEGLTLIPSENHASRAVLEALSSVISDKYAEGYPGRRYYAGNEVADKLETLVQERAKALFNVPFANVQAYSGSPANLAIYTAVCKPGDSIMGLHLLHGGHLTHGWKYSATSRFWNSIPYGVNAEGRIDLNQLRTLAEAEKPKIIICGGTALPRAIPFEEMAEIAESVGAYLLADVSHISGLIVGQAHESPVPYAHIVMTTTHKTLRGPRGALIMITEAGLKKDPKLAEKIDKAIIPGLQGGPHLNTIAGIGVALREAAQPAFAQYAQQVVSNAKALSHTLAQKGFKLVSGGTDNHLILIDLSPTGPGRGAFMQIALEQIGVYANKNTVPEDPGSPIYPSGLRIGTPAITTRGMKETEMETIAGWIAKTAEYIKEMQLPGDRTLRSERLIAFTEQIRRDPWFEEMKKTVRQFAETYPLPQ